MTFENLNVCKIACIGAGYVGGPTMAFIALKCPHLQVHVLDINQERIDAWNSDILPIYEPGLDAIVKERRDKNLFFSCDMRRGIAECDIIFICVNTPTKDRGLGAGKAADLSSWELAARSISEYSQSSKIVIEKSTVPVRTAAAVAQILKTNDLYNFMILSNPEFLAEGTAIRDLQTPDRILVGGPKTNDGATAISVLIDIYAHWVPRNKIICTNLWSSELSKLVSNAFLAQRVASINSVALLCEETGADITQVSHAIGMDSRICPKFLNASVGFGGSCFRKDILSLVYLCEVFGLPQVALYWQQVVDMNELTKTSFATTVIHCLFNTVYQKRIAIFGFAYKKDTSDTRETPALTVCDNLMTDGAVLAVYDPKVTRKEAVKEFKYQKKDHHDLEKQFITCDSPTDAARGAHAIVVVTEWEEFKNIDYAFLFKQMIQPAFIFDGRNILDHDRLVYC
eukprot:GHVL01022812.1.p1 GENE.GHVL01022812.1~~GHVL01022812.1.p1  ORF type:complete len:455 (-),score=50.54 GHVL01022812.1:343-1707(-)